MAELWRKEKVTESISIPISKKMREGLDAEVLKTGDKLAEIVREAIAQRLWGDTEEQQGAGLALRILAKAPCGPFQEAVEQSGYIHISQDIVDEFGARESDVAVRTSGDSMDGAGIPDGALLLMRPLMNYRQPRSGKIALIQIIHEDGTYEGTIKHWMGEGELQNGNEDVVALPSDTREVIAVAEAVGIISLL